MECENYLCVYNDNNKCILDKITLDTTGLCLECIYVSISDEDIKKAKEAFFKEESIY